MSGELDLCTKKRGDWSIYQIYPKNRQSDALKDAAHLKSTGAYDAVMLLDDENDKILFSYVAHGDKTLSFKDVKKGLDETSRRRMAPRPNSNSQPQPMVTPQKNPSPPPPETDKPKNDQVYRALNVGLGGFLLTLLILAVMTQFGTSMLVLVVTFLFMGILTITATMAVYKLGEDNNKNKQHASSQVDAQKKLHQTNEIFTDIFMIGKNKACKNQDPENPNVAPGAENHSQTFHPERRLALMLYMLGMSQGFKHSMATQTDDTNRQIAHLFSSIGIDEESVLHCAANLPDYLVFPQYHAVYERGISDAQKFATNPEHKVDFDGLFAPWTKSNQTQPALERQNLPNQLDQNIEDPSATVPESNFALVVFTDIVGSTDSIRNQGEEWMMDVLYAHNSIVREAIQAFGGHEVKHTGDGIMMSFPTVKKGVKASIAIQKAITTFNTRAPHRSFPLRIGMSAGEPMVLEGDLFGLPVNLAARVLPYAEAFEIAMSEVCHGLCQGFPYTFTSKENCDFKGFDAPQTVYLLNWQNEKSPAPDGTGVDEILQNLR